jgi:peptide/nickel transport system ATP-binding protein
MSMPVLSVKNLSIDYIGEKSDFRAVDDVSFDIAPGEFFGLAGESGCGKSTIAFAISRLHRPPALIRSGEILLEGRNVLDLDKEQLRKFRWSEVAMVFQSAMNSLNPVLTIETQFYDVLHTISV